MTKINHKRNESALNSGRKPSPFLEDRKEVGVNQSLVLKGNELEMEGDNIAESENNLGSP